MPDTIITCKNFIEAVEKNLYGFNWVCPSGGENCHQIGRKKGCFLNVLKSDLQIPKQPLILFPKISDLGKSLCCKAVQRDLENNTLYENNTVKITKAVEN